MEKTFPICFALSSIKHSEECLRACGFKACEIHSGITQSLRKLPCLRCTWRFDRNISRRRCVMKCSLVRFNEGAFSCIWKLSLNRDNVEKRLGKYLHVSVYIWIWNNSCLLLPSAYLHHNLFPGRKKTLLTSPFLANINPVFQLSTQIYKPTWSTSNTLTTGREV